MWLGDRNDGGRFPLGWHGSCFPNLVVEFEDGEKDVVW